MTGRVCDIGNLMPVDEAISRLLDQAPPPPLARCVPGGGGRVLPERRDHRQSVGAGGRAIEGWRA